MQRNPASLLLGGNPFRCLFSRSYKLHLTFDDGPMDTGTTRDVLNTLKTNSIQGTWFIQGDRLIEEIMDPERVDTNLSHTPKDFPEFAKYTFKEKPTAQRRTERMVLLGEIKDEGHLIGTHTLVHKIHNSWPDTDVELERFKKEKYWRLYFESDEAMKGNILKGIRVLEEALGQKVDFIRLPYGAGALPTKVGTPAREKSEKVARVFSDLGLAHIGWNVDSMDYEIGKQTEDQDTKAQLTTRDRYERLTNQLASEICKNGGGIILFHDNYQVAATYLPQWIPMIFEAGHAFVGLKELQPRCFDVNFLDKLRKNISYDERTGALTQCWN